MQEKYTNVFLGYGPEDKNFALELTYNYGKDSYNLGTGFGHFALALPDVYKACESIKSAGQYCRAATNHVIEYLQRLSIYPCVQQESCCAVTTMPAEVLQCRTALGPTAQTSM